jgi:hypothetical protein
MTAHTNDIFIVRSFREYKPIMKNKKNNVSSKYIYSEHFLLSSQGPRTLLLLLLLLLLFLVYVCVWKSSHIIHANFFPSSHLCCYISTKSDRANKKLCHHRAYFVSQPTLTFKTKDKWYHRNRSNLTFGWCQSYLRRCIAPLLIVEV